MVVGKTGANQKLEMESSLARARKPDGSTRFFSARLGPSPIFLDLIRARPDFFQPDKARARLLKARLHLYQKLCPAESG